MQDEAFHEIQLNGKQLVFLFMAATVVSVVIFLCGVMVGRGVPTLRAAEQAAIADQSSLDPTAFAPGPPVASGAHGTPIASQEILTYPGRLEDPGPATENLTIAAARATASEAPPEPAAEPTVARAKIPAVVDAVAPAPAANTPAVAATVTAAVNEREAKGPAVNGFVVQVAAVRHRAEADTIARRLTGKGYPAFVTTPAGAANVFRVRVGKYPDRRDAETVAGRLEREEQFKPWVTR